MSLSLSHTGADAAIADEPRSSAEYLPQIITKLTDDLRVLSEQGRPEQDFERFERAVHERFVAAEREMLAGALQGLDVDLPAVEIGGRRHRRVLRCPETYLSAVGPITVERTLYRAGNGPTVVALEVRAGIIAGHWTPLAARQASVLVARMTPQESADTLCELGNMSPSKSTLDRLPKHLSSRWEEDREAFEEAVRAATLSVPAEARTVAVSLDGVMAPMKDGDRQGKRAAAQAAGRATKGPAGYREVGCGTVSCYDGEGERLNTLRIGRMPEGKKATLKQMLSAELEAVLGQRPDLEVVKLADGAHDNWSYLDELAPQAQCSERLVDFFHAAGQLRDATDAAYGENDAWGRMQYEKHRHVLRHDHGGVERVIRALRYLRDTHPRRKRLKEVLGYFRRNRHRMDYAGAAERGLPIGSGVVEAACKVRQANWHMTEGESPLERRSNRSTFLREPCAGIRKGKVKRRQRYVRADYGAPKSCIIWSAETLLHVEGNTGRGWYGETRPGSTASENSCTHARHMSGLGRSLGRPGGSLPGPQRKGARPDQRCTTRRSQTWA